MNTQTRKLDSEVVSSREASAVQVAGWALILAAVSFMAVFSFLAARFAYPEVLDGAASDVLPALLAMGSQGRAVWALYALIPLLLVPVGVGAQAALRSQSPGLARAALVLAAFSAAALMLGLLRWPSIHWSLAHAYVATSDETLRAAISVVFDGLNSYLGNFIGEFVGELTLNAFFLVVAIAAWHSRTLPRWSAFVGAGAAVLGLIAMWRNVTPSVAMIAELENWVLPLWMLGLGVVFVRAGMQRAPVSRATAERTS